MRNGSRTSKLASKAMGIFGDVRPAEVAGVAAMFANLTILLLGYYIAKTVREPLILATGGAEMKAYAAGVQAFVLMGFVPLYSWLSSRVKRMRLIITLNAFFIICLELFWLGVRAEVPRLGFVFFVWVGIFSLSTVAQFWSYANEVYSKEDSDRLFPIIGIGATVGAPVGSGLAAWLFTRGFEPGTLLHITAGLLVVQTGLYLVCRHALGRGGDGHEHHEEPLAAVGGFKLVLTSGYLRLIAVFLMVLNLVNTTGEYILSTFVTEAADAAKAADASIEIDSYIGAFYGEFFSFVNIAAVLLQAFVAPRLTKRFGIAGVLFFLPLVSLGAYGIAAVGLGFTVFRWAKTAENSVDYSLMNTAKAMLWLPTTRAAKYKAKQAVDTFFVRFGDVLSAGVIWAGTQWFAFGRTQFALLNVVAAAVFLGLTIWLYRGYQRCLATHDDDDDGHR